MKFFLLLVSLLYLPLVWGSENSVYEFTWLDKDKEVYVLQNRKFRKDGRFYIGGTGVKTISGAFVDSYGFSARAGFFFKEDWGIELLMGKSSGSENDTAKGIRVQGTVPYSRRVDSYSGAMLMWSPFYSKINTFNKIFYYDWMFGLGAAQVKTLDNRGKFEIPKSDSLATDTGAGIVWNTGFRFYISQSWSARIDFTGLHWNGTSYVRPQGASTVNKSSKMFSNYDLGVGLNYSF